LTTTTMAERLAAATPITGVWYPSADGLPPLDPAAHVTTSAAWAAAWERVETEVVLATRSLHLQDEGRSDAVTYYLVDRSPFWGRYEREAGVAPVWPAPVLWAGSCYGIYGGAGGATPAMAAAVVDRGLELAAEWGACALAVPNLTPPLVARWQQARPTPDVVLLDFAYTGPIRGGLDGFLAAIPARRNRSEFRRQLRHAEETGLRLHALRGADMLPLLGAFTDLAIAAADKHGHNFFGQDIFEATARVPGAVLLTAEHDGTLAGGFLCFRHGSGFYAWAAGIDYDRLATLRTYTALMAHTVTYAAATGATQLHAGRGNHRYKRSVGLTGTALQACIYLTRPNARLQAALAELDTNQQALNGTADPTVSWWRP